LTKEKKETITLNPDKQIELKDIQLFSGSSRIRISLYKGDRKLMTSPEIPLPAWKTLPNTSQLYWMGKEKNPGQRGAQLRIPLHLP
jgi:hypothetical protein